MIFEPQSLRLHLAMGGQAPVSNHRLKVLDVGDVAARSTGSRAGVAAVVVFPRLQSVAVKLSIKVSVRPLAMQWVP